MTGQTKIKENYDLLDFLQGMAEFSLYRDEINYHAIELKELVEMSQLTIALTPLVDMVFEEIYPSLEKFNRLVHSFDIYCLFFKEEYLMTAGNKEARELIMLEFNEKVSEIRQFAMKFFNTGEVNLIRIVEAFYRYSDEDVAKIRLRILKKRQPYCYSSKKLYFSESDARKTVSREHLRRHKMAKIEFLGKNWYPKYLFQLD